MLDDEYGSINVTIRVYENNLLSQTIFERMLAADSFEGAVSVLRETTYREDVERVIKNHEYNGMIEQELDSFLKRLFELTPNPTIVELASLRYVYHDLKVLFKETYAGLELDELQFDRGRYPVAELRKAVTTGRSELLPEVYLTGIQEVQRDYAEFKNVHHIEVILDRYYFTHLKALALEIGDADILSVVNMQIDMKNISTVIRAQQQKRTANFMRSVLSEAGTFTVEQLISMATGNERVLVQTLMESRYNNLLSEALVDGGQRMSSIQVDQVSEDAVMRKIQEAKLKTFGPMPMLAFIYAKETEAKNLRLVLSAKENKIDNAVIVGRMRLNYVS